ncbi:unnamed protein product [Linum trigynum]|uniref:Uncharacterized protein n=1 Tax=Linum trigynum TaxID=586398 RepID=A0AAV2GT21_9ROSI
MDSLAPSSPPSSSSTITSPSFSPDPISFFSSSNEPNVVASAYGAGQERLVEKKLSISPPTSRPLNQHLFPAQSAPNITCTIDGPNTNFQLGY